MVTATKHGGQAALSIVESTTGKRLVRVAVEYREGDARAIGTVATNDQRYNLPGVITYAARYLGAANGQVAEVENKAHFVSHAQNYDVQSGKLALPGGQTLRMEQVVGAFLNKALTQRDGKFVFTVPSYFNER